MLIALLELAIVVVVLFAVMLAVKIGLRLFGVPAEVGQMVLMFVGLACLVVLLLAVMYMVLALVPGPGALR